jgi:HSP20 family protein
MALMRFSTPLRDMLQFQNEMNRLFSSYPAANQEEALTGAWAPQVDIYEDADGIRLHADLPGIEQKDLDIQVDSGTLTLKGERRLVNEAKKENYHRIERSYGMFSRSFSLPDYADTEHVEASFKNGVLEVKIPKRAEKKPKQIKVEVK